MLHFHVDFFFTGQNDEDEKIQKRLKKFRLKKKVTMYFENERLVIVKNEHYNVLPQIVTT